MRQHILTLLLVPVLLLLSYLIGSVMSAIWTAKIFDLPDPRSYGSLNPGATNMARSNHKLAALLTFSLDICKGFLATWLALSLGCSLQFAHVCGSLAVLGHMFPLYHDFVGGKGAATYFGVIVTLNNMCGLITFIVWSTSLALFRNSGFSAVLTACITPILALFTATLKPLLLPIIGINLLIIIRHYRNIEQLILHLKQKLKNAL